VTGGAVGRVLLDGKDEGSGFAITDHRALTAGHVVRKAARMGGGQDDEAAGPPGPGLEYVVDRGEPAAVPAVVEYQPEGAEPIAVTRIEVSTSLDVAVLHLQRPAPAFLPAAGQVMAGEQWRVETQPKPDDPVLEGTVTEPQRRLKNKAGKQTTLVQLWVQQEIGDYKGYSGSPVTAPAAAGLPGRVLGVLVEQTFWRTSGQLGEKPPVANVLYAAPIEQVLTEFSLTGVAGARSVMDIPRPAPFEVGRPDQLNLVIGALLASPTEPPTDERLVGLVGMGGAGKSVLAAAAARDPKVAEAFPDGRFWLELGPDPSLLQLQGSLAAALGDRRPITRVAQGRARLSRLLAERKYLLVLDNVWDQAHVPAFNVVGPSGRVLATTRDAATLPAGASVIPLGELRPDAAMLVLAGWAGLEAGQLPREAGQVARECGYLPLALAVCGALVDDGTYDWEQLLALLREADLGALRIDLDDYPHPSLAVALAASIDTLPLGARDRYRQLAVFNGQGPVPAAAVQVLWGLDQQHTTTLVRDLADKSLLRTEDGRVSLHDLQMDYLARSAPDLPALHNQLLAAYAAHCPGGWASGPNDGYFYEHLAHHLHHADRLAELRSLLFGLDWMNAKLTAGKVPGLLADYATLPADPAASLVAGALRLSAQVLADDPGQLPGQLMGRLASQDDPQLRDLLQRILRWPATRWLRPLTASLTPPDGPLQRTMTGHDGEVMSVTVTADGRVISGSDDGTVRVWGLDTGELLRTLTDERSHHRVGGAVAVSADGRRAVFGDYGGTVRVWDLDSGELLHSLTGHLRHLRVEAVAVTADGRRAVSGGYDGKVLVWDLDSGELLHSLTGHHSSVRAVAVSADGRCVVSGGYSDTVVRVWDLGSGELLHSLPGYDDDASSFYPSVPAVAVSADGRVIAGNGDGAVRVWDLDSGELLRAFSEHDASVFSVAVSADSRWAVTGGSGKVLVWDLDSGELLHSLTGHESQVWGVAVSVDGRHVVSGGRDRTVRVWDLDSGTPLRILPGYRDAVTAVAISADGRRAVSGGKDETVQAWDLDAGASPQILGDHRKVTAVAISADGSRAVSAGTGVRVWDLDSGTPLYALTGYRGTVTGVAISADGRRAVSGHYDRTVRVWDLDSGTPLYTLTGHREAVTAVAVSADGSLAASGSYDRTVRVWDLATGKQITSSGRWLWHWPVAHFAELRGYRGYDYGIKSLAASADGRRALSWKAYGPLQVWDLDSGKLLRTLTRRQVLAVAVSADGRCAVSGSSDGAVLVWDLDSGGSPRSLIGHDKSVDAVALSADGRCAVSAGADKTVRVWDLAQDMQLGTFVSESKITTLAVASSGTRVVAGTSTGAVHLLDLCGCE
jgi:WD40 repeat protein